MLFHFLRHAPIRDLLFLRAGGRSSTLAIWIDRPGTELVLAARGKVQGFEAKLQVLPECPRLDEAPASARRQFTGAVRRMFDALGGKPAARFVVDAPTSEVFVTLKDFRGAREKRDAQLVLGTLRNAPASVLGQFSGAGEWRWSLFNRQLEPITAGLMPDEAVVVGVSANLARRYEKWADSQGIELLTILPAVFALVAWALSCVQNQTAVFVAHLASTSLRAIFAGGQLVSLRLGEDAARTDESARGALIVDTTLGVSDETPWLVWRRNRDAGGHAEAGTVELAGDHMQEFSGFSDRPEALKEASSAAPPLSWLALN